MFLSLSEIEKIKQKRKVNGPNIPIYLAKGNVSYSLEFLPDSLN